MAYRKVTAVTTTITTITNVQVSLDTSPAPRRPIENILTDALQGAIKSVRGGAIKSCKILCGKFYLKFEEIWDELKIFKSYIINQFNTTTEQLLLKI